MKDIKIVSFKECSEYIWLSQEGWSRVRSVPAEERLDALRREFTWPEGFLEMLKGKTLEEQMSYYRIVEEEHYSRTAYGEITKENKHRFGYSIENYPGTKALVVEDGVLIGVCIKPYISYDYPIGVPAFPYRDICTYSSSDNNGAGSNDRDDYAHLCCVME